MTTSNSAQIKLVLTAVFLAYLAQMTLNPIIAPLSREVGLAEWQVGVTISTAAIMVVLTAQMWGRRSQSLGRKRVLVAALTLSAIATAAFALISQLGMIGVLSGTVLFALFVVLRGIGFGTAIAAIQPTTQAYIADVITDETTRIKGIAGVGVVQGVAQITGSVVGGLLAAFGLMAPILAVPVLLALGLVLVALRLRPEARTTLIEKPVSVRPTDSRAWPFLLAGFGMFTALGFIQIITGFIVQDRLHLDAKTAGVLTGAALLAAGIGMILAQTVVVPKDRVGPGHPAACGRRGCAAWIPRADPRCRASRPLRIDHPHRPGPGYRHAWLHRRTNTAGLPRGTRRPASSPPTWVSPSLSHPPPEPSYTGLGPLCRSSSARPSWPPSPCSFCSTPDSDASRRRSKATRRTRTCQRRTPDMTVETNVVSGLTRGLEPASTRVRTRNTGGTIGADHRFRLHLPYEPDSSRLSKIASGYAPSRWHGLARKAHWRFPT